MGYQLDPFQRIVPINRANMLHKFQLTANGDVSYPNGVYIPQPSGQLGAHCVRWNPSGTSVAWAHRINTSTNGFCISVYDFSGGSLTLVKNFVNGSYGSSVGWLSNTTLVTAVTPGSGVGPYPDAGTVVWNRSGNNFIKQYQQSESFVPIYKFMETTPVGIFMREFLHNNDLTPKYGFAGVGGYAPTCSHYSNGVVVFGGNPISPNTTIIPLRVYRTSNGGVSWTEETTLPQIPKYPDRDGIMQYPPIESVQFQGSRLLVIYDTNNVITNRVIGRIFNRNGINSWTTVADVTANSNSWDDYFPRGRASWRNSSEFAVGRTGSVAFPVSISRFNASGATIEDKSSPGLGINDLDYHPSLAYIAGAYYNEKPYFRVYPL